ncbi:glycosyl hydrolase family 18 protein [Paenibacillus soyae]|uniref:chitinase n=1 Tax=Paenibacillus soyae TaxID=2969249 RepID=A0A9X2MSW1_9BACL|nr:glycosyl hydrolase family 18 protein [Paenibacillus soyae]MCR2805840.1 glycosyl hydrolase family 18 protein [Paenibacillus soyae]
MNFSAKISPYFVYVASFAFIWTVVLSAGIGHASAAPRDWRAPIAPSKTVVSDTADTYVSLSWKAAKDDRGVSRYDIYNESTKVGTSVGTSYKVTGLKPETEYSFKVRAADAAGNLSPFGGAVDVVTEEKAQVKAVIGYYTGWSTYSGHQISEIDGSKLTHINYAFANIGQDLKIEIGDVHADVEKWFPGDSSADPYHGNFNQLRKLKQRYPHLKTFISVGGWSWSGKFSDAALTDASRSAFADSAVSFLTKYGFDGIDIDWEYPVSGGMYGNVKRAADKQNFTLLMQKLREKLDEQGAKDGKSYLLSLAGASGGFYRSNVELSKLQQYADFINVMSYDLHGTWDSKTGFNAPLYRDPNSVFAYETSVDDSMQGYLKAGVPAEKLVMGVPFYGYKYDAAANTNKGLYQSFKGGTSVTYGHVVTKYLGKGYTRYFHPVSKVPYLYNGSSFISYDDPESIGHKAAYVKENNLAGAMVWSLTHDSSDGALLKALYEGLQD